MGGLETAVLVLGFAGMAAFTSLALYFAERRVARRAHVDVPVPDLAARLQPADVSLKVRVLTDTGPGEHGTRFVIEGVCDRLTLRRERPVPAPRASRGILDDEPSPPLPARELEIGDPDFDAAFFVLGPPALVYAILDADTRRLLRKATAYHQPGDIAVEHGELRVFVPLSDGLHPSAVAERGREAVALARQLLRPDDVARRLSENAQRDPVAAVRLRNLNAALREEPGSPMTREALLAAAGDRDVDVRLRAALALGADGMEALVSVADDPSAGDVSVETAIQKLGAGAPFDVLARVLQRATGADLGAEPSQPRAARACLEIASGLLAAPRATTHARAAQALGSIGGQDAEGALIGALASDAPSSRLAAAKVLGDVGTADAVAPLREAERRGGELRRVARHAIAEIQSRLTGAPGEVSLAGGEAGQVSVVEDARGRVSVPEPTRVKGH